MKRKTVYIWMSAMVTLSIALFAVIYFLNLESTVKSYTPSLNPEGEVTFQTAIYGDFDNPLKKPLDAAKIGEYLYVSDTGNHQIQVFDMSGNSILIFGESGSKEGQLNFPYGIAGDSKENIYVADMNNGNISIFDTKGKFIKYFEEKDSKNKVITSPGGLRIYDDKLYVTDIRKNKVFVFDLEGNKLLEVGGPGKEEGKFIAPNAVSVDQEGKIYVTDSTNSRVEIFDKDGKFLSVINGSEDGKGTDVFVNPRGVGINSKGTIFIVSKNTHNVYTFDEDRKPLSNFGGLGSDNSHLYFPNGLNIDSKNNIYITDTINGRVSIYK